MRIAIVKLSALGDIVHAMVVLQFIKNFNKEIKIDWFVEARYKELLEFHPHVDKVHLVNIQQAKKNRSIFILIKDINKIRKLDSYSLVIDMQGLFKSAIISWFIPSKRTVGFDKFSIREKIASVFYDQQFNISYKENVVKRNFELLKFAFRMPFNFENIQNKSPFLFSSKEYQDSSLSSTIKNVVIIPGASNPSKQYPVKKIAKLTQMMDVNFIVIWGNQAEKILAHELTDISPKVNISDCLSLDALISLVSKVDLVIGGDTGPTHLAWALNIPSITLFGCTPGYRNTFQSKINKIIESKSAVNPLKIDKNDYSIQDINVEEIFKIASNLLSE